ncbi:NAD+ synthase [Luteolibacter pohnpeiensis]|uniref:Glutamine-dependent NAD(+) synthetase n=1 Tax=Luteolibacter pohnpeiensis TaxID=454153 RepID=A0A934S1W6_9BACT|nr:NAD+ synthase [Luteolibacter pohnpeiensis]MBK1880871.1 NAD+ synthase [Luteolibacter pohnpeiensis]
MNIGIAQINAVVGDFPGNVKRLLAAYRECLDAGAELVITPEMSLVGYPPRDLVFKSHFVPKCLQALDHLAGEIREVPLLVGYVDYHEATGGKPFRNAAAWLEQGAIVHRFWKTLLPTYDVFDERRYFEPGEACEPIVWNGKRIGVTICEDIWTDDYLQRPFYDRDPVSELSAKNMDLLLNLSASPFHLGKPAQRRDMLAKVARQSAVPVVYCNSIGGNDQLLFDGHSMVINAEGRIAAQLNGFVEQTRVVNPFLNLEPEDSKALEEEAPAQLYRALVLGLRDYATKCGFTSVCLGLSGGIDSALTAAIAADALGPENVHGLTMPSPYSSGGSVDDSIHLAKSLGIRCDTVPIRDAFETFKATLAPLFVGKPEDVTEENLQARIRGVLLMALSNKDHHLLLTTGNKSELAVGYCTIYGDMCGGLAVISDLPKTRVYEVCRWLNREREIIPWNTIEKPPSAELRPDQKDQDTLPEYEILDAILENYVEKQLSSEEIIDLGFDEATVRWIQRRVDLNEWKRQQAAPGIRVTSLAFGMGRRMPIVQRFVG